MEFDLITNTREQVELFYRRDEWAKFGEFEKRVNSCLSPHSDLYYSNLCPIYSYEIQTLSQLQSFSIVLFRDGLASLIDFFLRFRDPNEIKTKIAISKKFESIIPRAWDENIYLYETHSNIKENKESLIYVFDGNELCVEKIVNKLKKENYKKLIFLPIVISAWDYEDKNELPVNFFNNGIELNRAFDGKVLFQSIKELSQEDCKASRYLFDENTYLWSGDSFVEHQLLSQGVTNSLNEECLEDLRVELSSSHYVILKKYDAKKVDGQALWNFINGINCKSSYNREKLIGRLENLVSDDVINISRHLISNNYKPFRL